jgi:MoxR-like ATPase
MAAGAVRDEFGGGNEANRWLRDRDFEVVPLHLADDFDQLEIESIRRSVEQLCPNPDVRRRCLDLLADSILKVHEIAPSGWAMTSLRLTVYRGYAFVLGDNVLWLVLDRDVLDEEVRARIESAGGGEPWHFGSMPFAYGAPVPLKQFDDFLPLVRDAYDSHLERAARMVLTRTGYYRGHKPAVIEYLRQELDRDIPQPAYVGNPPVQPTPKPALDDSLEPDGPVGDIDLKAVESVRRTAEQVIPDPVVRIKRLELMANSIELAHTTAPLSWSTRQVKGESFLLYVANLVAFQLHPHRLYIVLDKDALDEEQRALLDDAGIEDGYSFESVPFSYGISIPTERIDELFPQVRNSHESFIERAARMVRTRSHYHQIHQPEVIQYLREELGRDLPQPAYSTGQVPNGVAPEPSPDPTSTGLLIVEYQEPPFSTITSAIAAQGMRLDPRTLRRYHLALKTRGFVVLSGLSGTGKTWLAEAYARSVRARHAVVAVAPNWTTNEDLLGYHNPLTGVYHHTTFSKLVGKAAQAYLAAQEAGVEPQPYHLVLDEMNLARVEYYFAQFLSAMEVRARHGSATMALGGGEQLLLPPNLYVIGTVNVDETTHGFADKVYDRAQLIELGVRKEDLAAHVAGKTYAEDIMEVWEAVRHVGPFAFRILDEIHAYVSTAEAMDAHWSDALDEQILQKVLPKLKGADPRVGAALAEVVRVCTDRFPLSYSKASRMLADFNSYGFASYFG